MDSNTPETPKNFDADEASMWEHLWKNNPHLDAFRDYYQSQLFVETFIEYSRLSKLMKITKSASLKTVMSRRTFLNNGGQTMQEHLLLKTIRELKKELSSQIKELGLSPLAATNIDIINLENQAKIAQVLSPPNRELRIKKNEVK